MIPVEGPAGGGGLLATNKTNLGHIKVHEACIYRKKADIFRYFRHFRQPNWRDE